MSKEFLVKKMEALKIKMDELVLDLDYYGSFDVEFLKHSKELKGASSILSTWIAGVRNSKLKAQPENSKRVK